MIAIYIENSNPKLEYVFKQLIEEILGFKVKFFNSIEEFKACDFVKISYCEKIISNEYHLKSSNFFQENDLIKLEKIVKSKTFLDDKLAVCFALLTRLEEYFPHKKDKYNRFPYSESFLFKIIDVRKPYVNKFAYEIVTNLQIQNLNLKTSKSFFEQPSFDLDHPFLIKNKTFKRTLFSLLKPLLNLNFSNFFSNILILLKLKNDDFDVYNLSNNLNNIIYFLPLGKFSKIDSFHSIKNKKYVRCLKEFKKTQTIHFHPSFASNFDEKILVNELNDYYNLFNHKPKASRQHYIALNLAKTYQNIVKNGIYNDYSMGFPDQVGFRAGICSPYFWFDIENNTSTKLKIFPFCWMDVTLTNYLNLSDDEILSTIQNLKNECLKYNGFYCYIIHNESFNRFNAIIKK